MENHARSAGRTATVDGLPLMDDCRSLGRDFGMDAEHVERGLVVTVHALPVTFEHLSISKSAIVQQ